MVADTGLAIGTVRKAMGVLVDEDLIYTVPGRGTFVKLR
jgi:DNA-binding GntR family transcriptional regulator